MNRYPLLLIAAAGIACSPVLAQQPPRDGPPPRRMMHNDQRPDGPLERFLGQMAQENPEEFARLKQLREQDPERFHQHLQGRRDLLRTQQILKSLAELPRFREVIESLTPEERAQLQQKFGRFIGGKMDGRPGMRRSPGAKKPGKEAENQIRQLAREYREAPDERKEEIRSTLQGLVEASYEQGETERRRNIEDVERRLEKLKEILATRAENRDEIIGRRVQELTDGDPLAW